MQVNRNGITRIVFIFNKFVIKVANFTYSHQHFLQGCYCNWSERVIYRMYSNNLGSAEIQKLFEQIAPSYFCSWFGLFQIQAKCEPLDRDLTEQEKNYFKDICSFDNKKENFGYYQGRLVCLDYP